MDEIKHDCQRKFVVTAFGDRHREANDIFDNIRQWSVLPIEWWTDDAMGDYVTDHDFGLAHRIDHDDLRWQGHKRYGVRMSNWAKAEAVIQNDDRATLCILDDDMKIVDSGFLDGFALAEIFGVCLPQNPRTYVKHNGVCEDTTPADRVGIAARCGCMPAINMSPCFVAANTGIHAVQSDLLYTEYQNILVGQTMRGTHAMAHAMVSTGIAPMILPEQWCVGRNNAAYLRDYGYKFKGKRYPIKPLCLHWGQPGVRKAFGK